MKKRARWAARLAIAEHRLAPHRVKLCGRQRIRTHVDVLHVPGSAWFDGVVKCRTRFCPVCWIARRAKLAHEIKHVVTERTNETRVPPLLATMTIRHAAKDHVSIVRGVRHCWRKHIAGREWQRYRKDHGVEWIVAEEVTLGQNGWHPHLHVLMMPTAKHGDVLARAEWWSERWCGIVRKQLGMDHEPDPMFGTDLRPCQLTDYLTKLGLELTDAGAVKGRSPLAMLEAGQFDDYATLQDYRHRARDLTWSRGLRSLRDSIPPGPAPELAFTMRGSEYGRLHELGAEAVLAVLEGAAKGEGQSVAESFLGALAPPEGAEG